MKFSLWLEKREVADAIMGVLGVEPGKEPDFMDKKTTYFGSEIRNRLKGLGVVKKTNDNRGKYGEIVKNIDDGITISDLVKKVGG